MGSKRKHVQVLIGWYNPRIIQGFCHYAHEANWHIDVLSMMTGILREKRLGDGALITNAHTPQMRKKMLHLAKQIPCVLHGPNDLGVDLPTSETDEVRIGELAAEHLIDYGHKQLAVFAQGKGKHIDLRIEGFIQVAQQYDIQPVVLHHRSASLDSIVDWFAVKLKTMRPPLGLFALDDILASEAIEAAEECGWRVPEDLAVIGVGNHLAVCEYSRVPISSVEMPTERQAYEAARMLDKLMSGATLKQQHAIQPPQGIITRKSSEYLAVTHPQVRQAIDFIRNNAANDALTLSDVAEAAHCSISNLYNLFREELYATPAQILKRFRLEKAHDLVIHSDEKISTIGALCGFASTRTFQRCFFNEYKAYPSQIREAASSSSQDPLF